MSEINHKPNGTVRMPSLLCALAGGILAISLDLAGFFSPLSEGLSSAFAGDVIQLTDPITLRAEIYWVVAVLLGWGISVLTLTSTQAWRRILVGAMLLTVALAFSPVLALWGIFCNPIVYGVAALWAWLCSVIYATQHHMPCDDCDIKLAHVIADDGHEEACMKVETIKLSTGIKSKK